MWLIIYSLSKFPNTDTVLYEWMTAGQKETLTHTSYIQSYIHTNRLSVGLYAESVK